LNRIKAVLHHRLGHRLQPCSVGWQAACCGAGVAQW
jgi:hypothetical protein